VPGWRRRASSLSAKSRPALTGNSGQLYSSVVTNNGTLLLIRQDAGPAVFGYTNNIVGSGKVLKLKLRELIANGAKVMV